jgi:ribosomal protein S18 acetylase RimI-like enzyme
MSISLRRLGSGDESAACEIASRFKSRPISREYAAHFLANVGHYVFAAEIDGEVVGFVLAYRLERIDGDAPQLFVYEVDVAPEQRRHGVGTLLMQAVRDAVGRESMKEAFVVTERDNAAALAVYRGTGARAESESSIVLVYPGTGVSPRIDA